MTSDQYASDAIRSHLGNSIKPQPGGGRPEPARPRRRTRSPRKQAFRPADVDVIHGKRLTPVLRCTEESRSLRSAAQTSASRAARTPVQGGSPHRENPDTRRGSRPRPAAPRHGVLDAPSRPERGIGTGSRRGSRLHAVGLAWPASGTNDPRLASKRRQDLAAGALPAARLGGRHDGPAGILPTGCAVGCPRAQCEGGYRPALGRAERSPVAMELSPHEVGNPAGRDRHRHQS